tara:strand:- start:45 stop:500 length:456 start_codon:yes stop_codon:yes gene_type:complete
MIHESEEMGLLPIRQFWKSHAGESRFSQMVTDNLRDTRKYTIDQEGKQTLHMALIGTESRTEEETNESVRSAAEKIAERLNMTRHVDQYFQRQGKGPLPARHHVLHSTMERTGLNSNLDLASSASVGAALASHSYSDFLKSQKAFRHAPLD